MKCVSVPSKIHFFCRLVFLLLLSVFINHSAKGQMPPPGFDYYKKKYEERMKVSPLDRDSITVIDTVEIFDPSTYESQTSIIAARLSLREYCLQNLRMANAEILLDGNPHVITDPRNYNDLTIRLNPAGKIDTIR
jgi:hypothetical protein